MGLCLGGAKPKVSKTKIKLKLITHCIAPVKLHSYPTTLQIRKTTNCFMLVTVNENTLNCQLYRDLKCLENVAV